MMLGSEGKERVCIMHIYSVPKVMGIKIKNVSVKRLNNYTTEVFLNVLNGGDTKYRMNEFYLLYDK